MPGWFKGCSSSINGVTYSNKWIPVAGSPTITEYDLFNANNLIMPIKKLINYKTDALKNYKLSLYQEVNYYLNNVTDIQLMTNEGKVALGW